MPRREWILCLIVLFPLLTAPARADLTLFLQDTTVAQGGYGEMNIWIGSNSTQTDLFSNYSFELQITGPNVLQFAPNPFEPSDATPQTQNYNYLSASNYIFPGDSLNGGTDSNGGLLPGNQNGQQFIGFDQSFDAANYAPANNLPGYTLLASVVLYAYDTNVGDIYTVSVVPGTNTFFNQIDPMTFQTIPGTDLNDSASTMTGYTGKVMIGAAAVPEPGSIVSGLAALGVGAVIYGARRLRSRATRSLRCEG
jgi:hypothetical protein